MAGADFRAGRGTGDVSCAFFLCKSGEKHFNPCMDCFACKAQTKQGVKEIAE